jgi:hypothetical protein
LLELPHLQDRPALFSTFLMWPLADLFQAGPNASKRHEKPIVEQVVGSSAFKQFARSVGREIVRGLFGAARRRR